MTVAYVNTTPQSALLEHPRAVYRVTLQRAGISALSFAAGIISWPDVVESAVSAAGHSPYGVPLGYARPGAQDKTAIVEIRAGSASVLSVSDSVGDLVRALDTGSPYARVTRIERLPPVPVAGSPDAKERDASRKEAEREAAEAAATSGLSATIERALTRAGVAGLVALGVGALVAVLWVAGLARKAGPGGDNGGGTLWT